MSREDIIKFMNDNPNVKVTHFLFGPEEYIYQKEDGKVYDENNYLFDDWHSERNNGMRMRTGGSWDDGWDVMIVDGTCELLSKTTSGKEYLYNSVCRHCQYFRGACKYL